MPFWMARAHCSCELRSPCVVRKRCAGVRMYFSALVSLLIAVPLRCGALCCRDSSVASLFRSASLRALQPWRPPRACRCRRHSSHMRADSHCRSLGPQRRSATHARTSTQRSQSSTVAGQGRRALIHSSHIELEEQKGICSSTHGLCDRCCTLCLCVVRCTDRRIDVRGRCGVPMDPVHAVSHSDPGGSHARAGQS